MSLWDQTHYECNRAQRTQQPPYPPQVELLLRFNYAALNMTDTDSSQIPQVLSGLERCLHQAYLFPMSWPRKLEYVFESSDPSTELGGAQNATALHYFVRHGPFIVGRTDRRLPIAGGATFDEESNDNHDDQDDDHKPTAIVKKFKKRHLLEEINNPMCSATAKKGVIDGRTTIPAARTIKLNSQTQYPCLPLTKSDLTVAEYFTICLQLALEESKDNQDDQDADQKAAAIEEKSKRSNNWKRATPFNCAPLKNEELAEQD